MSLEVIFLINKYGIIPSLVLHLQTYFVMNIVVTTALTKYVMIGLTNSEVI